MKLKKLKIRSTCSMYVYTETEQKHMCECIRLYVFVCAAGNNWIDGGNEYSLRTHTLTNVLTAMMAISGWDFA